MKKYIALMLTAWMFIASSTTATVLHKKSLRSGTRSALLKKSAVAFTKATIFMGSYAVCCSGLELVFEKYGYNDLKRALKISSDIVLVSALPVGILVGLLHANYVYQDSFEHCFNNAIDLLKELESNCFLREFSVIECFFNAEHAETFYSMPAFEIVRSQLNGLLEGIETNCSILRDIQDKLDFSESDSKDVDMLIAELKIWKAKIEAWFLYAQKCLDKVQGN